FFFQAEDGIRDFHVTGVQTCALPISILVCKSVAEIVKTLSLISKRKFSRIGNTVLLLDAPLTDCNCFSKTDVDTMNLIMKIYTAIIHKSCDNYGMNLKLKVNKNIILPNKIGGQSIVFTVFFELQSHLNRPICR